MSRWPAGYRRTWPRPLGTADAVCLAAIRQQPLTRDERHWRFGRRLFNRGTVNRLIAAGAAVRIGDEVRVA